MPEDSKMVAPPSSVHSTSWPSILCRLPSGAVRTTGDRTDFWTMSGTSSPLTHPRLFAMPGEGVAAGSVASAVKVSSLSTGDTAAGAKATKSFDLSSVRTGCPDRVVRTLDELTEVSLAMNTAPMASPKKARKSKIVPAVRRNILRRWELILLESALALLMQFLAKVITSEESSTPSLLVSTLSSSSDRINVVVASSQSLKAEWPAVIFPSEITLWQRSCFRLGRRATPVSISMLLAAVLLASGGAMLDVACGCHRQLWLRLPG
mmetsp:Transcript_34148/g.76884  ORF Transcript_34148/g.76884 Transcript_34148/m.76884 type:complete len:264 (+) Transcript_34148:533-1324(+)